MDNAATKFPPALSPTSTTWFGSIFRTNWLENWYRAYMQNNIQNAPGKGLTDFAYSSKPIHESNFEYSVRLDYLDEPDNILEEVSSIISRVFELFN